VCSLSSCVSQYVDYLQPLSLKLSQISVETRLSLRPRHLEAVGQIIRRRC
jgi:hypothetical protein